MDFFILMIIIMVVMGLASQRVKATFMRFSKVPNRRRMTGAQAARYILDSNGLTDVAVERVAGDLTDHYDPRSRVLRLSQSVYDNYSVSAVGVAAHEAGHALQDKTGYVPLMFRQSFYPIANIGSNFGMLLIFMGMVGIFILGDFGIMIALAGLALYACAVLFTIVTLPVEFNASKRALAALTQYGIVTQEEHEGTRKVLNAAALTYVAAAVGSVLTLLYYASIIMGGRD